MGEVLDAVVFPWEGIFGHHFSPTTGGDNSLGGGSSSGVIRVDLSLASGSNSIAVGGVLVSGVTGTTGLGDGLKISSDTGTYTRF